ncbi:MAG: winged helix DNA-binding protein [Clostridia bacterium]|nr:winged helix DNA-binding protein [Clostridia bacterium]
MDSERFSPFVLFIERISKNIKRIEDDKMEPYGLRSSHVMCILQLAKNEGGLSSTALSEACGVDKAFISRITSELIEKEYVMKDEKNATGKYKTKLILTDKGVEINNIIVAILEECFKQVDASLTSKKLEIFYEVLEKVDTGIADLIKE